MTNRYFRNAALLSAISLAAHSTAAHAVPTWLIPIPTAKIERINDLIDKQWDDFREAKKLADNAHYAGDCKIRDEALDRADRIVRSQMDITRHEGNWDAAVEKSYQDLIDEVAKNRALPCPEPAIVYTEDPVMVPGDPGEKPLSPDAKHDADVSRQQGDLDLLESTLDNLEKAWRSGDCAGVASWTATYELYEMNTYLLPKETMSALRKRLNEVKARRCPPVLPPRLEAEISGFFWGSDKKVITGTGVLIDPGNERFIETSDEDAQGQGVRFRIIYNVTTDGGLSFSGQIGRSTDRNTTIIAPGTTPVGSVYHDRATNGSTGIALGATGLDAVLARDSEYDWFGAAYERRLGGGDGGKPQVKASVALEFEQIRDVFELELRSPTFPTISMDARQEVSQTNLGVSAGVSIASSRSATVAGVAWEFFGKGKIYHADTDLDSVQRNICGPCGVAERDHTITVTDRDKRWGIGAEAGVSLGYRFKGGLEFGVKGSGEYGSDYAGVENPETGDDLFLRNKPTQLFFDSSLRWTVGVYAKFQF